MSDMYLHYLKESVVCRCTSCGGLIHEGETCFIDDETRICSDCFWHYLSETRSQEEVAAALDMIVL